MIEMTWGQVRDPELSSALNGLARQKVPFQTTLKLLTISKAIEAEQKKADAVAQALIEKYMKKSEDGKSWELKNKKYEAQLKKEEKEFIETKFKIRVAKLKASDLEGSTLSAVELFKLESLVEFEDAEKPPRKLKTVEGHA